MKGVRDDGRDNIRPGMDVGGANPLWSKNGETPNPVSGQPKQSEAQKEVQRRTEKAAAEAQEKMAAKQKVMSREAAVKAEAALKVEEENREEAARAAAKIADQAKQASRKAAAATRNAARKATRDEAVHRRESNRAHKEKVRDAEIGPEAAARMADSRQRAREAEAASTEALRPEIPNFSAPPHWPPPPPPPPPPQPTGCDCKWADAQHCITAHDDGSRCWSQCCGYEGSKYP